MASPLQVVNSESANNVEPSKTWFDLPEEIQSHIIKDVSITILIFISEVEAVNRALPSSPVKKRRLHVGLALTVDHCQNTMGPILTINRASLISS